MLLAYAESADSTGANMALLLVTLGVIIAAAVLALVPVGISRARRHARANVIAGFAVLWALATAASLSAAVSADMTWARERNVRIMSGYFDPRDETGAPRDPWGLWAALGAAYLGLVGWSVMVRREEHPSSS